MELFLPRVLKELKETLKEHVRKETPSILPFAVLTASRLQNRSGKNLRASVKLFRPCLFRPCLRYQTAP